MNLMDPDNPMMSGVVQNQDSYMKGKIAQRWYYDQVEPALEEAFDEFYRKTGRRYDFVEPYRCEDAEYILVGMGCYMETAKTTVDYLRDEKGIKAGCLHRIPASVRFRHVRSWRRCGTARPSPSSNGWTIRCRRRATI